MKWIHFLRNNYRRIVMSQTGRPDYPSRAESSAESESESAIALRVCPFDVAFSSYVLHREVTANDVPEHVPQAAAGNGRTHRHCLLDV